MKKFKQTSVIDSAPAIQKLLGGSHSHPDTGETILNLTPRHAGESPLVVYASRPEELVTGKSVDDLDSFTTGEGTLYFLAKDQTGQYETGTPVRWTADLKIRHQVDPAADKRRIVVTPHNIEVQFRPNGIERLAAELKLPDHAEAAEEVAA